LKRRDLVRELEKSGCELLRHGGKHDIYHNPDNGRSEPVPRHREINELLAKKIIKSLTKGT
jgi:predicted RNA binding protein YcfA (HicA-like mRNA interferase family)